MKELIFDPLGLAHTFFFPADVMTYRFAVGHLIMPEETTIARPWPLARSTNAAGAIATNLKDLLRYAQYHMGDGTTEDGTRLLTPDSLREMHTTHFPISDKEGSIGLAWFLRDVDGARTISHGGGTHGQITQLTVVPAERFAFALFTNGSRGGEITRKMGKWILKAYLGRAEDEPQPMEATEAQLAEVVGLYSRPFADIEVKNDNGQLMAHMTIKGGFPTREHVSPSPPPMPIAFCGDDRFIVTGGPFKDTISEIVRKADGSIGWLRSGLRIHNRVS